MLEYTGITIGLILLGDAFFVPSIYLAILGHLNLTMVLLISFLVSNTMDIFWYHLGKMILKGSFRSLSFIEKYEKNHPQVMEMFFKHQLKIVFWSRFLHGSGTSIMILSGVYNVPFKKYMTLNFLSSLIVIFAVPLIVFFAREGASAVFDNIKIMEWIVAFIVLLIFISIRFKLGVFVNKILFPNKKTK